MYAKIENGEIVETAKRLKDKFPNTMFNKDGPEEYEGWYLVTGSPEVPEGKKLVSEALEVINGKPVRVFTYEDKNSTEKEEKVQFLRRKELSLIDGEGMDAMRKELQELRAAVGGEPVAEAAEYFSKVDAIKTKYPKPAKAG